VDLTGGYRSDRCATTQSEIFEAEDTRQDRKACVEAKQVAVAGHPSDGESFKSSKTALEGLVSLLTVKIRQPSHEFTFGVGITFVSYSLVLTPVV
jgi:hypothetical protein